MPVLRVIPVPRAALGNERGSAIVLVAASMVALLSMAALAIDLGMLCSARSEAQRTADAAALAGAASFLEGPPSVAHARTLAIDYASRNKVRSTSVVLLPEDVEVDLAQYRVTVTVRRIEARGTAVATWFARVFGVDLVDVVARATAEASPAGAGTCLKPFTIPDAWNDANNNGVYNTGETYSALVTGYGTTFRNGVASNNGIDPSGTTYVNDFGRPIVLKAGKPQESIVPGWYFPWDIPLVSGSPSSGADRYRWNISHCNTTVVTIGEPHNVENGDMKGPTKQGVADLVALDPNAQWNLAADSVVGSAFQPWKASPRVINIPLFDPTTPVDPGKKPVVFNNMTAFWVHGMQSDDVVGRYLYASGIAGSGSTGSAIKFLRLIE